MNEQVLLAVFKWGKYLLNAMRFALNHYKFTTVEQNALGNKQNILIRYYSSYAGIKV